MFFNSSLERLDAFIDERIMFKVSPNPGLNLTHLRTTGPRRLGNVFRIQDQLVQ